MPPIVQEHLSKTFGITVYWPDNLPPFRRPRGYYHRLTPTAPWERIRWWSYAMRKHVTGMGDGESLMWVQR